MEREAKDKARKQGIHGVGVRQIDVVIKDMIKERRCLDQAFQMFHELDENNDGVIDLPEFIRAYQKINKDVSKVQLEAMFEEADLDGSGTLDLDEVSSKLVSFTLMNHSTGTHCIAWSAYIL